MQTIARLALVTAAALGAALFFSGCTTARMAKAERPAHFYDMTVMQSSGPVNLSAREMTRLREAVIEYVQSNGVLSNGAYYVEVKFNPAEGATEGAWIVVKLVERNVADYEMVASYSNQLPYYYDPFYSRYGYASFGNYPFDSYDYGYDGGYFPPRVYPHDHRPPNDNDHTNDNHHHGGGTDVAHNGGHGDYHPRGSGDDHRPPEPRRWDRGDSTSTANYTPSSGSGGGGSSYSGGGGSGGGSSYSPPPAPSNPEPAGHDSPGRDTEPVAAK